MARYFFNMRDDEYALDEQGIELPNLTAARHEVVAFAMRRLTADPDAVLPSKDFSIEAWDNQGELLLTLQITSVQSRRGRSF